MTWVLRHSDAKLGARLVLIALADYAHADGSEAYPSVDTLAANTRLSRRAVQAALRKLEEDREVVRDGKGRNGTTCYRLTMGGADSARGAEYDVEGAQNTTSRGANSAPNPSLEPSSEPPTEERVRGDAFPDDLAESMHDTAIAVGKVLKGTALERGQKRAVTRAAVGQAIVSYPDRPHLQVARDLEAWLIHGKGATKPCADVVARYRQFLKTSEPEAGPPMAPRPGGGRRNGGATAEDFARLAGWTG